MLSGVHLAPPPMDIAQPQQAGHSELNTAAQSKLEHHLEEDHLALAVVAPSARDDDDPSLRSTVVHWHLETMFASASSARGERDLHGTIAVASVILGTVGLFVVRFCLFSFLSFLFL